MFSGASILRLKMRHTWLRKIYGVGSSRVRTLLRDSVVGLIIEPYSYGRGCYTRYGYPQEGCGSQWTHQAELAHPNALL